jgi:integrase
MISIEKISAKTWEIVPYADSGKPAIKIRWDQLDFDNLGTKHQREYLKQSVRELLEALVNASEAKVGALSPLTVRGKQTRLWRLVSWMVKREIWLFSELQAHDMIDYVQEVISKAAQSNRTLRAKSIDSIIGFFREIWQVRLAYISPMRTDPDTIRELQNLVNEGSELVRWSPIPIALAIPLIQDALTWIKTGGPITNRLLEVVKRQVGSTVGKNRKEVYRLTARAYEAISASDDYVELTKLLRTSEDVVTVLRSAVKLTDGAAISLILLITGVRISELRSLLCGCVSEKVHDNGNRYLYINGTAAKKKGKKRSWVVPEVVADAIGLLEKRQGWSDVENVKVSLFTSFAGNGVNVRAKTRKTSTSIATLQKLFCRFALSSYREAPFPVNLRLHPHQCRKTFARFVMCRDKRALGALVQHYGHLYAAVLDGAYVGSDIELQEILDEENRADLAEGLMDLLTSGSLGGKAGRALTEMRSSVQSSVVFGGKTALEKIVNGMIGRGIRLAPCNWGYCLYEQETSACRGSSTGPDPINRCASTCASCTNFVITEKYRQWWEERFRREEAFLDRGDLPEQTKMLVASRLEETALVLKKLNLATGVHPIPESQK